MMQVMYPHRHTQYNLRIILLFRSVGSVITEQDDMIICCDTCLFLFLFIAELAWRYTNHQMMLRGKQNLRE